MSKLDSSPALHADPLAERGLDLGYRSVCKTALASFVFGVLSLAAFLASTFVVIPAIGLVLTWLARSHLRRYPDELTGARMAAVGFFLSAICLVGATAMHAYIYATEVPEGYQRISFGMLDVERTSRTSYAQQAEQLDGRKVFLKGYVRPGDRRKNLKKFILVGDFGTCCFGGNPKITDVVGVIIQTDQTVDYSLRLRRIGGTFRLVKNATATGESEVPQVFYQIEADYIQ